MVESNWDDFATFCYTAGPSQLLEAYQDYIADYQENPRWDSLVGAVLLWRELNEMIEALDDFDRIFFQGELDYELPEYWGWYVALVYQWIVKMEHQNNSNEFCICIDDTDSFEFDYQ